MAYPYEILELDQDADDNTIRKAYLEKIHIHTPENEPEYFQELTESYNMIKNEVERSKFKVFGVFKDNPDVSMKSLVSNYQKERTRIGVENWISLLEQ